MATITSSIFHVPVSMSKLRYSLSVIFSLADVSMLQCLLWIYFQGNKKNCILSHFVQMMRKVFLDVCSYVLLSIYPSIGSVVCSFSFLFWPEISFSSRKEDSGFEWRAGFVGRWIGFVELVAVGCSES